MLALQIYNKLTKKDITKGRNIVGTGTIDKDGRVGDIGGIKYKLRGAVKKRANILIYSLFLISNCSFLPFVVTYKKLKLTFLPLPPYSFVLFFLDNLFQLSKPIKASIR